MPSSHEFRSLKAKIRVLCKQRRIRLESFMMTFDTHRVKKIKVEQFKRALDVSGLHLNADEMQLLLAKYRLPEDPSFVNYRRFCDSMDKVFTVKGLEAKPELHASIHNELPAQKKISLDQLSSAQMDSLQSAKKLLRAAVMNKGIVLKDVFHDFDRNNAGKVTKPQFVRDLADIVTLSKAEMDALLKAYGDDLDVHYRALHFDICPGAAGAGTTVAMPRSPERRHFSAPTFRSDCQDVQDVEAELSGIVLRDRIRTKNFFTDFDSLRTGKCSEAQFKRCVKLCFGMVSDKDLDLLVRKYIVKNLDTNKVDYIRFCNAVEGKTSANDNNCDNILASIAISPSLSAPKCTRDQRGALAATETDVHQAMITRLSSYCTSHRILLKPTFQDFDKGRREHITVEQFFRVLATFNLTLASDQEKRVLLKRYESIHGDRFINYVTFCYDIDHWESNNDSHPSSRSGISTEILQPTRVNADTFEQSVLVSKTRSVPMLMRYIKQVIKRDRIQMEEFYRDFDKLRHSKITFPQFAAGLNAAGLVLAKDEMRLLGDQYACEEVDSLGLHFVAWKRFVDEVESVFTVRGLERVPHFDLVSLESRSDQFGGVHEEKELTTEEERRVTAAVVAIKKEIDRRRLVIKPAFEDFDRSRQGFVSMSKFERVLSMFNLLPEASLARLIEIKFREQIANGTALTLSSICDVNYRAFLQALEIAGKPEAPSGELQLPGSVMYRQELYSTGIFNMDLNIRHLSHLQPSSTDLAKLLAEIRRQLNARRVRIKEFITEGDKLRSGEITLAKFHTALNRSGCVLDAADVETLSRSFLSAKNGDKIDWRAFLDAVDHGKRSGDDGHAAMLEDEMQRLMERLKLEVNHRRLHMKPYFQDYDHNKIGRVTKFQFAAVLDMMKLNLRPLEIEALGQLFALRVGRTTTSDVNYLDFVLAVDVDYTHERQ